jgi:3-deoxy-7-phosphoheptulonate synthase
MKSSRNTKPEPTEVSIGGVVIGGAQTVVIAGPCAVESHDHLIRIARSVKASGAHLLRGGAFKPRTSPYSFQGHGEDALKWLAEARAVTGLKVVSEVMDVRKVESMSRVVDCLQVGTRNMQNFDLLKELGRVPNPVLLKRGMSATIEEWLLAAEYVLAEGNPNVVLCERGIRTFESATRNTLDLSAIPVLRDLSHLPIAVDPSHGTGRRDGVAPMTKAAIAAGADAVMIEVHDDPERALSDGAQSLSLEAFDALMKDASLVADACSRPFEGHRVVAFPKRAPGGKV